VSPLSGQHGAPTLKSVDRDMPRGSWNPVPAWPTVRPVDAEKTAEEPSEERPKATRTAPRSRPAERRTTELRTSDVRAPDRPVQPEVAEPRTAEPRTAEPRTAETRATEYRAVESRPVPTNIYRARRPAVAILLIIPAVGVGLLLIRALAISAFGSTFLISGVIASACALAALPLIVAGLYGLVTGAAHGAEHYGFKVWARPPLAYLLIGIALAAAAGLATR
jgi:hypothetical protein